MHPHVLNTERHTPRPTPWLDDFSGVSRREAMQELLARHADAERDAAQPSAWARLVARLKAAWGPHD